MQLMPAPPDASAIFRGLVNTGAQTFAGVKTFTSNVIVPSVNKVAITAPATGATLAIADGKTLIASNSITFTAVDGSTLVIGAGGTLGTGAYATIGNYAPLASPTFTGIPLAPTAAAATNTFQLATTAFVHTEISNALVGLENVKGAIDASTNPNYPAASKGDTYYFSVGGKIGGRTKPMVDQTKVDRDRFQRVNGLIRRQTILQNQLGAARGQLRQIVIVEDEPFGLRTSERGVDLS